MFNYLHLDIPKLKLEEQVLVFATSFNAYFRRYLFTENYIGPKKFTLMARGFDLYAPYRNLKEIYLSNTLDKLPDEFPFYRKTFIKDCINAVLMQVDLYKFRINHTKENIFMEYMSEDLLSPFEIEDHAYKLLSFLKDLGYKSIPHFLTKISQQKLIFKTPESQKQAIYRFMSSVVNQLKTKNLSEDLDIYNSMDRENINIIIGDIKEKRAFKYLKTHKATVWFSYQPVCSSINFKYNLLKTLIPGYLFYDIFKNFLISKLPKSKRDPLRYARFHIGPEALIRYGLASNYHKLHPDLIKDNPDLHAYSEFQKLQLKILYNLWYYRHIEQRRSLQKFIEDIQKLTRLDDKYFEDNIEKYIKTDKYYLLPLYVHGDILIEQVIHKIPRKYLWLLYMQHSAKTLMNMVKQFDTKKMELLESSTIFQDFYAQNVRVNLNSDNIKI